MKKIFNIPVLSLVLLFTVSGCKKILEPKIYSQLNANDFPKTESDVLSAFIPFYAQFNPNYGSTDVSRNVFDFSFTAGYLGYTWATTIQTDEASDQSNSPYSQFTLGPSSYLNTSGQAFYDRVSYVAKLTGLIIQINASSLSNKNLYLAEAKGLRAWFMYVLYDLYGPVSVKLDPATLTSNAVEPRLTQAAYVAAMESDLLAAISGLPDKYNGTANWGRLSKGTARTILFKVYLHDKSWPKAQAIGKDLIGMGYTLNLSYKDVFITPQNSEVIFAVPGNNSTSSIWYACIIPGNAASILGNDVTKGDKYQLIDMPWKFYDKYPVGDARLQTIATEYITNTGRTVNRANGLPAAIPMKYTRYVPNLLGFDYVIYRYADVLLAMAEITNEISGPTAEARAYLKLVTDRAGTTASVPASAFTDQARFRSFILEERGRELYFEFGIRRQDLIRNGTFISNAQARGISIAKPTQVLFPIPSDVIIQSGGVIAQNQGY
ncbi:MAG: RagB/SusD family nutrient uptake outer membrane protein [Chitinophagaceae bacterium]